MLTEIQRRLSAPIRFQVLPLEVRQWEKGLFAAAAGYVDRADVLNRLDEVLGMEWQDQYTVIDPEKAIVECRIGIRVGGAWLWRGDVGTGDPQDSDPLKAAYTDALKRAATQWGVGRFLYDLGRYWLPCKAEPQSNRPGKFRFMGWEEDPVMSILNRARTEGVWWASDPIFPGDGHAATTPLSTLMAEIDQRGISKQTVRQFCQERFQKDRPALLSAGEYEQLLAAVRGGKLAAKAAA